MKKSFFSVLMILLSVLSINAQNLLNNGSFEYGGSGVGFVINGSGYNFLTTPYSGNTSAGNYAFVTDPHVLNTQFFLSGGDHTTGSGLMLVIDGTNTGGQQRFWKAGNNGGGVCNLTVGTTYTFSYWIKTVTNSVAGPSEMADIGVAFNNASNVTLTYGTAQAPIPNVGWREVRYTFTATNTCVNIELYNNNTNTVGNDFAIDDLSLTPPPLPIDFSYSVTQPNCSDANSGVIVIYPTGGVGPYLFRVDGGNLPIPITNQTGVFQNLSPGTYTIGLKDVNNAVDSVQNVVISSISPLGITPGDTVVCPNTSLVFTASGSNAGYTWTSQPNDPELTITNTSTINVSPNNTTTYTVSSSINIPNLIFNGDFEQGPIGYSNDYVLTMPNNNNGAQRAYGVVTDPSTWYNGFSNCADHTTGNGTGKMMVIDGSTYNFGNDKFWCQNVGVEPNKTYQFSYWASTVANGNEAQIQTQINGSILGTSTLPAGNCTWHQIIYTWNSGNNFLAEVCLIDKQYEAIGNDFVVDDISMRSQGSCTADVTVTMATGSPDYGITYPLNICLNEESVHPATGIGFVPGGIYNATPQGLNIDNLSGVITPQGSSSGTYEVTYTAQVCGTYIPDTMLVVMRSLPNKTELIGGDYYCEGQIFNPLTLYVTGAPPMTVYYNVDGVSQTINNITTSPINLGNVPGVYTLDSITDAYCFNTLAGSQTISLDGIPQVPEIVGDSSYCKDANVHEIYVTNATGTINWYADSALTQSLGSSVSFLPSNQETLTYYATQSLNGCESAASSVTVYINECPLIVPSAFTPNGDGENDNWQIIGLDTQFPDNSVTVFNRWGETIYESIPGSYSSKPWDGKYKNALMPVGSYYYVIQRSKNGAIGPLNGTVSIILKK